MRWRADPVGLPVAPRHAVAGPVGPTAEEMIAAED